MTNCVCSKDLTGFEKPVRSYHKIENGINFRREDLTGFSNPVRSGSSNLSGLVFLNNGYFSSVNRTFKPAAINLTGSAVKDNTLLVEKSAGLY